MKLVWDLDGTIVDTKAANEWAYESLGVKPPKDFYERHWSEWTDESVHQRKGWITAHYIRMLGKPGPVMQLWINNGGTILTSASEATVNAVRDTFPVLGSADIRWGKTLQDKIDWLNGQEEPGCYFDDSLRTIQRVREDTKWTAILVR